jgi:hypothetical protein
MSIAVGSSNNILGINSSPTDMIAAYIVEDSVKYYFKSSRNVSINNTSAYDDLKSRAENYLSTKYARVKIDNEKDKLRVYFDVFFDDSGNVA